MSRFFKPAFFSVIILTAGAALLVMLLFQTPFARRPVFERLPGVSGVFCPAGTTLAVERYNKRVEGGPKNSHRVVCLDGRGRHVADVSASANLSVIALSAVGLLVLAWPLASRWAKSTEPGE